MHDCKGSSGSFWIEAREHFSVDLPVLRCKPRIELLHGTDDRGELNLQSIGFSTMLEVCLLEEVAERTDFLRKKSQFVLGESDDFRGHAKIMAAMDVPMAWGM